MFRNFEVTGFIRCGARIEVSGSKAYALKHYWDFMGFSTYLIFIFFSIKVLKLRFSLLLKSVITLVKKTSACTNALFWLFFFFRTFFFNEFHDSPLKSATSKTSKLFFFACSFGVIVNFYPFSLPLILSFIKWSWLNSSIPYLILSFSTVMDLIQVLTF